MPFVSAIIPINYFYVEDIKHELENNTQIVIITLKVGSFNEYFRYMKDRALELREISFRDSYELTEDKLKEVIYSKSHYR